MGELKELKERQKVQLRQKALKKGLDPEALTGKHPPKIRMYSKYERRTDTRTYEYRKKLYEGGWEVIRAETLEAMWKEKYEDWTKRPQRMRRVVRLLLQMKRKRKKRRKKRRRKKKR